MYVITRNGVRRESDGVVIPNDDTHPLWTEYVEWLGAGGSPGFDETPRIEDLRAEVGTEIQRWIDGVCRGAVPYFRDIFSARSYVNDPNPAYHARAVALRDWSSAVWTTLDEIEAAVLAGDRPFPTIHALFAELPVPPS